VTIVIQTQERNGKFGYVMTRSVGSHDWTSEWVEVPGATCHNEARSEAVQAAAEFEAVLARIGGRL